MAGIQRMIKSGIRLYNYNPRAINFAASPINRLGASANSYHSLCSSSCGDVKSDDITLEKEKAITSSMTENLAALKKINGRLLEIIENDEFTPQTAATTGFDQGNNKEESKALKERIRKLNMIVWVVGALLVVVTADTLFSRKILHMLRQLSAESGTTITRTPLTAHITFKSGRAITYTIFVIPRNTFKNLK